MLCPTMNSTTKYTVVTIVKNHHNYIYLPKIPNIYHHVCVCVCEMSII